MAALATSQIKPPEFVSAAALAQADLMAAPWASRCPNCHSEPCDHMTNTEAPKGTDLSRLTAEDPAVAINGLAPGVVGGRHQPKPSTDSVASSRCCVHRLSSGPTP